MAESAKKTCGLCTESLTTTGTMNCDGMCEHSFHISCLASNGNGNNNYKSALLGYLNKIPNLKWYCDMCLKTPLIAHGLSSNDLTDRLSKVKELLQPILLLLECTEFFSEHTELNEVQEVNAQQGATDDSPAEPMEFENGTPIVDALQQQQQQPISNDPLQIVTDSQHKLPKRRRDNDLSDGEEPEDLTEGDSPDPKLRRVGLSQLSGLKRLIAKPQTQMASSGKTNLTRSLYVSPFNPATEPSDIIKHLKEFDGLQHIASDIDCIKLLKRKQNKNRLTFVSFKLTVARQHFEQLSDPAVWEVDDETKLNVSEFVPKQNTSSMQPVNSQKQSNSNGNAKKPKNLNDMVTSHTSRRTNADHSQRVPNNRRQTHTTRCLESCCNHQQAPQHHYHRNQYNDHYAENQSGHRFNPFRQSRRY